MRKIEQQMNSALLRKANWSGSNTTVCYNDDGLYDELVNNVISEAQ